MQHKQIEKLKKVVKEMKNRTTEPLTDEEIRELEKETEEAVRLSEEARLYETLRERIRNVLDYWKDEESLLLNEGVDAVLNVVKDFIEYYINNFWGGKECEK